MADEIQDMVDALQIADRCWKEEHVTILAANAQVCIARILNEIRKSVATGIYAMPGFIIPDGEPLDMDNFRARAQVAFAEIEHQKVLAMERLQELNRLGHGIKMERDIKTNEHVVYTATDGNYWMECGRGKTLPETILNIKIEEGESHGRAEG